MKKAFLFIAIVVLTNLVYGQDLDKPSCCSPTDFADTKNIAPLSNELWKPKQIIEDFHKHKLPGQVAPLILLKTEFCNGTKSSYCAMATKAFEENASTYIKNFRVYGYWIYQESDFDKTDGVWARNDNNNFGIITFNGMDPNKLDRKILRKYDFDQGPGTNIIVLNPDDGDVAYRTDAAKLNLDRDHYEQSPPDVSTLDEALMEAIDIVTQRN
jgi:hypothetical protein